MLPEETLLSSYFSSNCCSSNDLTMLELPSFAGSISDDLIVFGMNS